MMKFLLCSFFVFNISIAVSQNVITSSGVKQLATSGGHSLALLQNGTLWAWGYNSRGQLGIGSTEDKTTPIKVGTDSNWCSITASNTSSYGVKKDGTLWGWGDNKVGQLGISTANIVYYYQSPVQIGNDNDWQCVAAGNQFAIGLKKDGTLWAWGSNLYNLQHTEGNAYKPVKLLGNDNNNWLAIAAGEDFFIAQKMDGSLWTKGMINERLQNKGGKKVFFKISEDTDWINFAAGAQHAMAIKKDGSLWGWGNNSYGQLGNGTTVSTTVPVKVGDDFTSVAASENFTTAMKNNSGQVMWWGKGWMNKYYQLKPTYAKVFSHLPMLVSGKSNFLILMNEKSVLEFSEVYGDSKFRLKEIQ